MSEPELQSQNTSIAHHTGFPEIDRVIAYIGHGIQPIFGPQLTGLYLTGSLSYGDFDPARSDIDLLALLTRPANAAQIGALQALHAGVVGVSETWAERLECAYLSAHLLVHTLPPEEPRPYTNGQRFYAEAPYGNEWIINLHALYESGIALLGPPARAVFPPVDIDEVRRASIRDFYTEWEPKVADAEYLDNPHYQSYLVLNLCRILYTVLQRAAGTKKQSSDWVKTAFPEWRGLVEKADAWTYGQPMGEHAATIAFIQFVKRQIEAP